MTFIHYLHIRLCIKIGNLKVYLEVKGIGYNIRPISR